MATYTPHVLRCKSMFDISGADTYLFGLASPKKVPQASTAAHGNIIAATASNNVIKIYSRETLQPQGLLKGHQDTITGLCFGHSNPTILLSCSNDRTVRLWDLRSSDTDAQVFKAKKPRSPLHSFDINCTDSIIAAGGELIEEDVYLYFWDIRSTKVLERFSESHNDDITQVQFHPSVPTQLISGSTDGLVCVYDISEFNEDESVVSILNSESSVSKLGHFGPKDEYIYCLTHTETFHVWNSLEATLLSNQTNVRKSLKKNHQVEVDYLVDCSYCECTQRLYILAGDHKGTLYITHANVDGITPLEVLTGGHSATVRCMDWNHKINSLVTGGEDTLLCHWQAETMIGGAAATTSSTVPTAGATQKVHDTTVTDKDTTATDKDTTLNDNDIASD